jgi:cold shock CspA family protein
MNGIVKSFTTARGFGFIQPLVGKPDETDNVYFHISACRFGAAPPVGAEVRFKIVRGSGGRTQAADVEALEIPLRTRARVCSTLGPSRPGESRAR